MTALALLGGLLYSPIEIMFAILLAGLFWNHLAQDNVQLPYGLQTYEQLASELTSAAGLPTRCDPAIRLRYALIRVPPRPWASLRPLLESALDIRFVTANDGALEIRKDAARAAEEDALRLRFSRKYDQTIRDAVRSGWELHEQFDALPTDGQRSEAYQEASDAITSLPPGNPDGNSFRVAISFRDDSQHAYVMSELWDGIDLGPPS